MDYENYPTFESIIEKIIIMIVMFLKVLLVRVSFERGSNIVLFIFKFRERGLKATGLPK